MHFNEDDHDNGAVFNGVEWITYGMAVETTEGEDCHSLLTCLIEAAKEKPTKELALAIKGLVEKMFFTTTRK